MSGSTSNSSNISNNNSKDVDERKEGIGQGELYSPDHAIKINTQQNNIRQNSNNNNHNNYREEEGSTMVGRGVANDIRTKMGMVKDRVLEKLAAASVPSDKLENARSFLETIIRDVTSAAQGITKEALQRIKSHLVDILPSVSPSLTSKIVDDAENEAAVAGCDKGASDDKRMIMEEDENVEEQRKTKTVSASPTSSFFSSYRLVMPVSRL